MPQPASIDTLQNEWIYGPDSKRNKYKDADTIQLYKYRNGKTSDLPIYYRNKIYSEEEREKLWAQMLDKGERWVLGQKISIKDGLEQYQKALKKGQAKNKRLGYGNNDKDWDKIKYENTVRKINFEKRIKKLGRST